MPTHLFSYIWQNTKRAQIFMLLVILVSMVPGYYALDVTRYIVNGPIQGKGFANGASQLFFHVEVPLPQSLSPSGAWVVFKGVELHRFEALFVWSALFLGFVLINGWFKYYINIYKGRLGERMLQQLRYELFDRVLRFPLANFSTLKSSEIATMIKDEVEPLGGFIGDAFVQPLFLGGQIATTLLFIAVQNQTLFALTLAMLLIQGFVIPAMRRIQLVLGRQRQVATRKLAGRIGEVIDNIAHIRLAGIADYQRADVVHRLTKVFAIRLALYNWKFFNKFLNNLLAQITPLVFYTLGGYFAILGLIDIGQLVAVISSYKELPGPVKDLIDWDQERLDVEVKFRQVMEQFASDQLEPYSRQFEALTDDEALCGTLRLEDVDIQDGAKKTAVADLNLALALPQNVALVNAAEGGADVLMEALARAVNPTRGHITLNGRDWRTVRAQALGRQISYVVPDPMFVQSSLYEALISGVLFEPAPPRPGFDQSRPHKAIINTAPLSLDYKANWVDWNALGLASQDAFHARVRAILSLVDLERDVIDFGFGCQLPQTLLARPDIADVIMEARRRLHARLRDDALGALVEPFQLDVYCAQASVFENLIFGAVADGKFRLTKFLKEPVVAKILAHDGMGQDLALMGYEIAKTVVELFAELSAENALLETLVVMKGEELSDYQALIARITPLSEGKGLARISREDRLRLIALAMNYVEPRERLGLLSAALMAKIIAARALVREALKGDAVFNFYDDARFNPQASLQDNIVFGRLVHGIAGAEERLRAVLRGLIDELHLRDVFIEAGLTYDIGAAGRRLTFVQRKKLALAGALVRAPKLLLMRRALQGLDVARQQDIMLKLLSAAKGKEALPPFGLIALYDEKPNTAGFDRMLVMEHGKLVEDVTLCEHHVSKPEPTLRQEHRMHEGVPS